MEEQEVIRKEKFMSIATINIDTKTQECALLMDGVPVQADEIQFYKGTDYEGNPVRTFGYTTEMMGPDGMMQKMQNMMAPMDSPEKGGMISREIKTKDKLYKEIEDFVNESNAAIKIVKNGPVDKPFCMVQDGKTLMCHKTFKEAQDHMNKMMAEKGN